MTPSAPDKDLAGRGIDLPDDEPIAAVSAWDIGPAPYQVICLASLLVIFLAQMQSELHLGSLLVPLIGLLGALARWGSAPILLLVALVTAEALPEVMRVTTGVHLVPLRRRRLGVEDFLLCLGVLAYVASHYRLQGLLLHVLPPDPRRPGPRAGVLRRPRPLQQRRSPHLATRTEVGLFLLTLPIWTLVAELAWLYLGQPSNWGQAWNLAGWPTRVNRLLVFTWMLGSGMFVTAAVLTLWKRRQHSAREAMLFLQDTLWRETRGDQRRLTRWLAWARLKRRGQSP